MKVIFALLLILISPWARAREVPATQADIDKILAAGGDSPKDNELAVQKLLRLYRYLDNELKVEAIKHIVNLTSDEKYSAVLPIFLDPQTRVPVLDILFLDLQNRDFKLQNSVLEKIIAIKNHPKREAAQQRLKQILNRNT